VIDIEKHPCALQKDAFAGAAFIIQQFPDHAMKGGRAARR